MFHAEQKKTFDIQEKTEALKIIIYFLLLLYILTLLRQQLFMF